MHGYQSACFVVVFILTHKRSSLIIYSTKNPTKKGMLVCSTIRGTFDKEVKTFANRSKRQ